MRFRWSLHLAFLLPLLLCGQPTWAWNDTGHRVTALIAWNELSPELRAKISTLLEKHPQFALYLKNPAAATPAEGQRAAFLTASTWPDIVRRPEGQNRLYHHGVWHYVDFPFVLGALPEIKKPVTAWTPGADPENALQALAWCDAQLQDPKVPADQKAVALAWLLHLIGDIHQPLHAISLYSEQFPEGDKGGNLLLVTGPEGVTNLHSLWDGMLGRYQDFQPIQELAEKIAQEYPREKLAEPLKQHAYEAWVQESFEAAKDMVYQKGQLAFSTREKMRQDPKAPVPELPAEYMPAARALARQRIALAGYRMADTLNRLLGDAATTVPSTVPAAVPATIPSTIPAQP